MTGTATLTPVHFHRSPNDLAPLPATRARLKRVERALARWDAYDAGQGPEPLTVTARASFAGSAAILLG